MLYNISVFTFKSTKKPDIEQKKNMSTKLPDISKEVEKMIFDRLETFNKGKTSDKGRYYILVPNTKTLYYTLWFYNPSAVHHPSVYLSNLDLNAINSVNKALRIISNTYYPLYITDNTSTISNNGDDIITFGKYRGHHLHEIYSIDPRYVCWIADKYEAQGKNEQRFKEIATTYKQIYLDLYTHRKYKKPTSQYIGTPNERLSNLKLIITKVRLEDDPYKTKIIEGCAYFYVDQLITAADVAGNLFLFAIKAKNHSLESRVLSSYAHAYKAGDKLSISSAKVIKHIESHNIKYTKLGYIRF